MLNDSSALFPAALVAPRALVDGLLLWPTIASIDNLDHGCCATQVGELSLTPLSPLDASFSPKETPTPGPSGPGASVFVWTYITSPVAHRPLRVGSLIPDPWPRAGMPFSRLEGEYGVVAVAVAR